MIQRVMVTAGGAGIGWAIAKAFADSGAKVHVCDVDERALDNVTKTYPAVAARRVDLTNEQAIDEWFDHALGDLGGLDVLINNAGTKGPTGYVEELKLNDWRECLTVCLDAQFLCARRAAPLMKSQSAGSIVNISSTAGLYGYGLRTPYAAAKWAVIGFTKSLAVELGPYGVRANAICPGSVDGARMQNVIRAEAESRGVRVDIVLELGTVPRVAADEAMLEEALSHIVRNAIEAVPDRGTVTITTWASEGAVLCAVVDTGVGMPDDVLQRAAEPFFTTKGPQRPGLGLSCALGLMRQLGGQLDLRSDVGDGTRVTVRLRAYVS